MPTCRESIEVVLSSIDNSIKESNNIVDIDTVSNETHSYIKVKFTDRPIKYITDYADIMLRGRYQYRNP